jgi:xanthine/CO dehydrogenase XdhC/CoxF family maturation factor
MQTAKDVHTLIAAADADPGIFTPRAAMATMVRTVGSSFRRPGSRMLIGGNGCVVRGFSGGCPESDLVLRAQRVIESGKPERVIYDREHGLDLLMELGCGGELEIALEPLAQRSSLLFLDVIQGLWQSRSTAMMASVFARDPVHGGIVGRLIWRDAEIFLDALGDGEIGPSTIMANAGVRDDQETALRELSHGGKSFDVLYESIRPPVQLVLIGANSMADAVARAAQELAWTLVRLDPKTTSSAVFRASGGNGAEPSLRCDGRTFVVCMTYNLERDLEFAAAALATRVPYVGVLGSHSRAAQVRRDLTQRGANIQDRLYSPAGLSIGSEDGEEIALSLIAEIMAVSARKSGTPLSRSREAIHGRNAQSLGTETGR